MESGNYTIVFGAGRNVGRLAGEPDNMEPKGIFAGVGVPDSVWVVGGVQDGPRTLANLNTLVDNVGGLVSARLTGPQAISWEIVPTAGGLWLIKGLNDGPVWTVPHGPGAPLTQIGLAALSGPFGGVNQAFNFVPA